jgi:hypothetical protein
LNTLLEELGQQDDLDDEEIPFIAEGHNTEKDYDFMLDDELFDVEADLYLVD